MKEKGTIFVIDSEKETLEKLQIGLQQEGYCVRLCLTGEIALAEISIEVPDLIILEVVLPDMNGLNICRHVKKQYKNTPVLILSKKSHELDILMSLEVGADDYIIKPFNEKILFMKIKNILKGRKAIDTSDVLDDTLITINNIAINPAYHEVKIENKFIKLTALEFKILYYLMKKANHVFSRYEILEIIEKEDYDMNGQYIDVLLSRLRKKMGKYGKYVETIYGVGYRFCTELPVYI